MASKIFIAVAALWAATAIFSCKKKENNCGEIPVTANDIQGNWKHDYGVLNQSEIGFILPPKFSFRFVNDSFYMTINQFSDIISDTNGCQYLDWKEYATGNFEIAKQTLYLNGIYTDSVFQQKNGGCYNIGLFQDSFRISKCNGAILLYWLNTKASSIEKREIRLIKE